MDNSPMRNPRMLIIIGGGILILLIVIIVVLTSTRNQSQQAANQQTPITGEMNPVDTNPDPGTANVNVQQSNNPPAPGVVLKVGEELLYEADLNYELAYYPASNTGEPEEILIKKMIDDSIILQAAEKEGLVELDETIYNSSEKDYAKRIQTVLQLKDDIDQKGTQMEGSVIAIWFHNMKPGSAGYERGKQTAGEEMNKLLVDLKAGRITMEQAGNRIKANQNLAQVDASWRANAYFDFGISEGEKITYSPEVDREIYKLNEGQVSSIITGKDTDPNTGKKIDAVYIIAEVSERSTSTVMSYDKWLENQRKQYEVTRY